MKQTLNNQNNDGKYEDFASKYLYKFSDILCEYLHKIPYMSPNVITTIRNLILIKIFYQIVYQKRFKNLGILVLLIGILDCVDGEYARKYKMISKLGDKYDHLSDIITTIILFYLLYKYSDSKLNVIIGIIFLFINLQHFVCLEKYRRNYLNLDTGRDSVNFVEKICFPKTKSGLEQFLLKYKFLGFSTYYMVMAILFSKLK
jgi:phosphatidylglycerophosphate synthase